MENDTNINIITPEIMGTDENTMFEIHELLTKIYLETRLNPKGITPANYLRESFYAYADELLEEGCDDLAKFFRELAI
jgi:hypothetical protein